jgi:hypothetical protein
MDPRRGRNQYNDCMVLQMIADDTTNVVRKAQIPKVYVSSSEYNDVCLTLRRLAQNPTVRGELFKDEYGRYWHGYVPVATGLLWLFDLGQTRTLLKMFVFTAILAFALIGWRAGGTIAIYSCVVALSAAVFWGLPYFGQGLSFAPAEASLFIGLSLLVVYRKRLTSTNLNVAAACGAYGVVIAYFEFLTGPLPTAAGLLFPLAFLLKSTDRDSSIWHRWLFAFAAVIAFIAGAITTVAIKQVIAFAIAGDAPLRGFMSHLVLYTGFSDAGSDPSLAAIFKKLLRASIVLTYYSHTGAKMLLITSSLCWLLAILLATSSSYRNDGRIHIFLAHCVGAASVPMWVLLLREHTFIHAGFMARILLVPICLGFSALAMQLPLGRPQLATRSPRAGRS